MERGTPVGELGGTPRLESDVAEERSASVRVLAYNVRHCRGLASPFISERRTAKVIRECRPDVAGLNEVYRWSWRDQPRRLSRLTDMQPLFHGVRRVRGGEYGNLLLGRFPLRELARIPLAGRVEARGCLLAEVDSPLGPIVVASTHLGLDLKSRRDQMATLLGALPPDRPLILLGDFNSQPRELEPLLEVLQTTPDPPLTFPSVSPVVALDRVLFSRHFAFRSASAPLSLASDHRPLVVELVLA